MSASFGSWWWTRKPRVLQSMGSQRVGHDWTTELNLKYVLSGNHCSFVPLFTFTICSCYCFYWLFAKLCWTLWPHKLLPTRLLCPWDFPGKNTGVGCHFLLFARGLLDPGTKPLSLTLQVNSLPLNHQGSCLYSTLNHFFLTSVLTTSHREQWGKCFFFPPHVFSGFILLLISFTASNYTYFS